MPAAERVAFCLRYVDGKQLAEVAELCDCSLATIKRRLQKAEAKLEPLRNSFEELER
jgi:RNA polymerase sigma-70 factor (ECF subfamily)